MTTDEQSSLQDATDERFRRDWELDEGSRTVRRKPDSSEELHTVWSLYRFLNDSWMEGPFSKYRFPMEGDRDENGLSHYKWFEDRWSIERDDLKYLSRGPLVSATGSTLVMSLKAKGQSESYSHDELIRLASDRWVFDTSRQSIGIDPTAAETADTIESVYFASRIFAASSEGIAYDDPMVRFGSLRHGVPFRYAVNDGWSFDPQDLRYLEGGPLYSGGVLALSGSTAATRVFIEDIDPFSAVSGILANDPASTIRPSDVLAMRERDVKTAFHRILGDPFERKDWGGERSDIFSSTISVSGRRVQSAMALKGRSAGKKVTMSSFGSNADQIVRLFEEPAQLYIIQANGSLESTLIKHIDQTARAQERELMWCVIDGTDTARLLEAYLPLLDGLV